MSRSRRDRRPYEAEYRVIGSGTSAVGRCAWAQVETGARRHKRMVGVVDRHHRGEGGERGADGADRARSRFSTARGGDLRRSRPGAAGADDHRCRRGSDRRRSSARSSTTSSTTTGERYTLYHAVRRAARGVREVSDAAQHRGVRADLRGRRGRALRRHHAGPALRPHRAASRHAGRASAGAQLPGRAGQIAHRRGAGRAVLRPSPTRRVRRAAPRSAWSASPARPRWRWTMPGCSRRAQRELEQRRRAEARCKR